MEKIALTMLTCYPEIPSYIEGIESVIWRTALYSYSGASLKRYKTTYSQAKEIIVLAEKKNDLIYIRQLVDRILCRINERQSLLARYAFFERREKEEILREMKLTRRTLYRRLHSLLLSFGKNLILEGFEKQWFIDACLSQSWIKSVYDKQSKLLP